MNQQRRFTRSWPCLVCALCCVSLAQAVEPAAAADELRISGGPYLQAPSPRSMTLVWTTNRKCTSKVEYGLSADRLTETVRAAQHGLVDANTTLHRVIVNGLRPGTKYYYRVTSTEILEFKPYKVKYGPSVQKEGYFTTLDPAKERFSFCVINDRHDRATELRQALASVDWEGVDLVFALGDVMNDPMSETQIFEKFINPCVEAFASRIPLVLVRGNHETRGLMARSLMEYFPTASGRFYYSFVHGGVHFLLLDGGEDKADTSPEYSGLAAFDDYLAEQTDWLRRELQSQNFADARFRICLLHIPPAVDAREDEKKFIRSPWIRNHWSPLLGQAGIDLMLSGHTHRYTELPADEDRAYPLVIGGTDTVIRVDVSPEQLRLATFKNDGTLLSRPPDVPARKPAK
ncbi:MAG TPA: metallophosphoesterase family protein [Phycisphaerae bacterium]|nr:metallophosphoesterase family protein [Phycisphaerae bacterium]HPU25592.1 metallophosphoesterase family protein [Phycisphaerae bacterium]HPZ98159.1 metallophosphoesterase family protein [Phycisphaerae bacterium]HQE27187.1 metallophosphoesterase family protein [Phycisphaerae bacterium]